MPHSTRLVLVLVLTCFRKALQAEQVDGADQTCGVQDAQRDLRAALEDAQQAASRLQGLISRYEALLASSDKAPEAVPSTALQQQGSGALAPFSSLQQRLVAHGLLRWSDRFQLLAAVHTDAQVTALRPVPAPGSTALHLVAVGDAGGRVYLFNNQGLLKQELSAGGSMPAGCAASCAAIRTSVSCRLSSDSSGLPPVQ